MELVLAVMTGLALSAACGFRVSVPPLIASLAAMSGHLTLPAGFAWLGTLPVVIALAVAAVAEVAAYAFPLVDHAMDVIAGPAAVIAGTLLTASFATGMDPYMKWSLALIAGGGLAGTVHAATGLTRLSSTATTAGTANPFLAIGELIAALGLSTLALVAPVAAVLALVLLAAILVRRRRKRQPRLAVTRLEPMEEPVELMKPKI